ncbi:MAG: hypothetical protein WAV40_03475 [Microgenomates group bacterium]
MQNIYQAKGKTLNEQYRDAGELFGKSIRESVQMLAKKRAKMTVIRRAVAEKSWAYIQTKNVCLEFRDCLTAWSEGAAITPEQAMWLLADNLSGCQTFIGRYGSGVVLLHTEEEFVDATHIELHMTTPHTIAFDDRGARSCSLVYNNLMPGCGLYGFKRDLITAVDTLFVSEVGINQVERPILANMVSWMIWRMSPEEADPVKIIELIESLGELVDGYAINVVRKVGMSIDGYKLTLARSEARVEMLGSNPGDYLRQTNLIDPDYPQMKWATPPRQIWRGGYRYFVNRYKTLDKHATMFSEVALNTLNPDDILQVHKLIQKTILYDLKEAYVNKDLGAVCIGLVDQTGTSVSAKKNDENFDEIEYLEILN